MCILHQVVVGHDIYVHPVCKVAFSVQCMHNLVCTPVAAFSHGLLLLLAMSVGRLHSVNGKLLLMLCHGRGMVLHHWIAGGSVLARVY